MKIQNPFNISEITYFSNYIHDKTFVSDGHRHRGYELAVITEGSVSLTCDENVYIHNTGDYYIIPAYSFHYNVILSSIAKMTVVHFKAPDSLLKKSVMSYHLTEKTKTLFDLFNEDITVINNYRYGQFPSVSDSAKKLFEVFLQYSTAFEEKSTDFETLDNKALIYKKAVNFMNHNLNEKLSVNDIAKECLVCRTTLKNIFSYYTGKGCIDFFNDLKLDKAKKLLSEGKSCAEVTDLLGFSSQSYFSKKFKKFYGYAPSQRRE